MTESYEETLNRTRAETPTLQLLPVGSYRLKHTGKAKFLEAKDDKNDCVMFIYSAMEPLDDVDAEELAALGDYDISMNTMFFRVWIEKATDWADFWTHVDKHGVVLGPDATLKEGMDAVKGSEIIAWLDQSTFQNKAGDMVDTNDPVNFAPVED